VNLTLLEAGFVTSYRHQSGEVRELIEPDSQPTGRQLMKLNYLGALALVEPGQVEPIQKGSAAAAIDLLTRRAG